MSEQTEYTKLLEKLITNRLLPVYEAHCAKNGIDIYNSGIPSNLLLKLKSKQKVAALLRKPNTNQ